ncbi:hypothetical protein [uncultured Duncaniella sp.]|uniref:hypothetical protein n=1 Tax=uncultured Duncaniella sp. TaxID=2768039 RepID=UPI00272F1CF0|nr:hypothetical protein [uncultured Duncaniella sp.]
MTPSTRGNDTPRVDNETGKTPRPLDDHGDLTKAVPHSPTSSSTSVTDFASNGIA